jgi:hypothetical protein
VRAYGRHIERLNDEADDGTTYKVLWLARHGQGVHNVVCTPPPHLPTASMNMFLRSPYYTRGAEAEI